ncbi:MAG: DUF1295 domain-containing protein [Spirochaetaceae bacterium]|nr:DUF1295 domain-containing protein [Spirochaetaceae bacterium]MDT8296960.1 DUF1295 domain-containing protein [Spirochaetaceae bacterium]
MIRNKSASLLLILLAYAAALIAAVYTVRMLESSLGVFGTGLAADLAATLVIFIFSMLFKNSSAYDPYWSVAPPVLFLYWTARSGSFADARTILLLGATIFWAVRLTSNWMRDWPGLEHEDWRYVEFREKFGKAFPAVSLGGIHVFPTTIVALASLPAWMVIRSPGTPIGLWDLLGLIFTVGGASLSFLADEQMRRFRHSETGGVMTAGLWGISRHPNYLGEIMFWFGLWFFAIGSSTILWWTGIGAVAMLLMFLFVSIPWMEERIKSKHPEFESVKRSVPILIPFPGRSMTKSAD